jgi:hypothetical protein
MPYFWCPDYHPTNPNPYTEEEIKAKMADNIAHGLTYDLELRNLNIPTDTCIYANPDAPGTIRTYDNPPNRNWAQTVGEYRAMHANWRCITHNQKPEIFFRWGPVSTRRNNVNRTLFDTKVAAHPDTPWRNIYFLVSKRPRPRLFHDAWATT